MLATDSTTIEHLRLRRAHVDASTARRRLSYLFSSVVLRPPGMGPSAVLVVRSMSDPLPEQITEQFASAAAPKAAWESAAQARLRALYSRAARPALGYVSSSAEAVLFADYGELLGCLALDFCANGCNAWWWKSVLRHKLPHTVGWLDVWAQHPLHIPSALHQLDERKQAIRVIERTTPAQAWRLFLAVARTFGLPTSLLDATSEKVEHVAASPKSNAPPLPESLPGLPSPHGDGSPGGFAVPPPWEQYVDLSSIPIRLSVDRRALLGLSLLLARAPHITSSSAFALQLRSWLTAERERDNRAPAAEAAPAVPARPPIRVQPDLPQSLEQQNHPPPLAPPVNERLVTAMSPPPTPRNASEPVNSSSAPMALSNTASAQTVTSTNPDSSARQDPRQHSQLHLENGCRTALGGVFYLIHLLRRSELLSFDIGFGGWALLELLARCLLYKDWAAVAEDPVWEALAVLDGREPGTHPGMNFEQQAVYEAPESWLHNLESAERYVRFRSSRVELWHPEGFLTLDAPQTTREILAGVSPLAHVTRRERHAWRRDVAVCPPDLTLSPELRRFLHFILPYARWRLRRALRDASLTEVLSRKGTLYITRSHVDLVMTMKQISMPARLAGLDANPGWMPALGRVINFHFVQHEIGWGAAYE
jgi:hypothetical protein